MNNPTIVIQYTCQESLERLPDIYIKNMKDSIAVIAENEDRLYEVRMELLNVKAEIDEKLAFINMRRMGITPKRSPTYELE